ncbi:M42 family metallopeptidase [Kamptonema cortianum]|nr:M42 family metallopeptidase [Kamptonema cortianum]MDL5053093.1 M42 family metallopeptidase [Oscillatoria laete-virens NRMC-F 0139]
MNQTSLQFLEKLINTPSPSGFETRGQRVWLDYVAQFADETSTDAYGNAIAVLNPQGRTKIMVTGHADEIGFMVHYITDEGFLYVQAIGGVDVSLARGQRVHVHGAKGPVTGVTGALAIHLQDRSGEQKAPKIEEIFIDIGVKNRKEAEKLVSIGDPVTYVDAFEILRGNIAVARACDNRIGTFAAAETLRLLATGKKTDVCVVAVSTVQEENGLYGAKMVGYSVSPDAALVIDVGHATDIPPCTKTKHGDIRLGQGPILSVGSANHPVLVERLKACAAKAKIPFQKSIDPRWSGTDADGIFLSRGGTPTACIGLPNRYMHTPVEMIDLGDLENVARLCAEFCRGVRPGEKFKVKI